jgi:pilus assembly protein CpaE
VTRRVIIAGCDYPVGRKVLADLSKRPDLAVEECPALEDCLLPLEGERPSVIVTCPSIDAADAVSLAESLHGREADTAIVVVSAEADTGLLRAALKAGVHDVLTPADGAAAIVAAVLAADASVARRRGQSLVDGTEDASPPPALGKVITVFSPKGGVGKSVLATNLGAAIAKDQGRSVILVDLDLQFGDVAVMLQLPPTRTIFDAAQAFDRLDADMLQGFLVNHDCGMRTLLAPVQPEEAESVTTGRITQILTILRQLADFVVIDTPASLSEVVLTALEQSDVILAVATMDVPSVKNTKVALQKLHQLGFDARSVRLVLNRADSKVWLDPREIERAMSDKIVARIPSDRLVPRSVNKGVPVVLESPNSNVARSILALAREVTGA